MVSKDHNSRSGFTLSTPWYHGWNIVAVTLLMQSVTVGLMSYGFTLWITSFQDAFGASQGTILLAASLSMAGVGFYAPIAGRLIDKFPARLISIAGITIFCGGYLLISVTTAIWQVIVIYATVLPVGALLAGPLASQVMMARWFEKKRGLALGIATTGTSLGGVYLPPIVAAIIVSSGWRLSHGILAVAIMVIVIPALALVVRERNESDIEPGKKPSRESGGTVTDAPADVFPDWRAKQIIRSTTVWVLIAFLAPLMLILSSVQLNIGPISAEAGFTASRVAYLVSTAALTTVLGKLLFGFLADRLEHRYIIGMAVSATLICLILLRLGSSYWLLVAAIGSLGLAAGGMAPVMGVVIGARYGAANFGRVYGIITPFYTIFAFAPVFVGYLRESLGSYDPIYILLMICAIPAIIAPFFLGTARPEVPGITAGQPDSS